MAQPLEKMSDRELALAAAGESGPLCAFEEIVRRYQVPLRHFLQKRFGFRQDLEDILQDSFLKAWQSLRLYNPNLPLRTWLYTITYRTAVSQGRKDRGTKPVNDGMSSAEPSPVSRLQQSDQRQTLWSTARRVLSDEQFTALWLHYVDDLPARDIAQILNRSWVSVKTLMHRARKKLEPLLAENPRQRLAVAVTVQAGEP